MKPRLLYTLLFTIPFFGLLFNYSIGLLDDNKVCGESINNLSGNLAISQLSKEEIILDLVSYPLNSAAINTTNGKHIVELQYIGRGFLRDAFLGLDDNLYSLTSIGLWSHASNGTDSFLWAFDSDPWEIVLSPDQTLIAVRPSSDSRILSIRNMISGEEITTLEVEENFDDVIHAIAFNHQGTQIAAAVGNNTYIWNLPDKAPFKQLEGGAETIAFSYDDRLLAVGGTERTISPQINYAGQIRIWNVGSEELVSLIQLEQTGTSALAFSPDGKKLASGGGKNRDEYIRLWDVGDGHQIQAWASSFDYINNLLTFSPNGKFLTHRNQVYSVENGEHIATLNGNISRFSPDGSLIIAVSQFTTDGELAIWDSTDFTQLEDLSQTYKSPAINSLEFDSDNHLYGFKQNDTIAIDSSERFLAVVESYGGSSDRSVVHLCEIQTQRQILSFDSSFPIVFSHDGDLFAIKNLCQIDIRTSSTGGIVNHLPGCVAGLSATSMSFNSDNTLLAIGLSNERTQETLLQIWDVNNLQLLLTLTGHTRKITSIAFSADNRIIATSSEDATIRLWGIEE